MERAFVDKDTGVKRWDAFEEIVKDGEKKALWKVVLCYLYPRIDANVSKTVNHLLKSPFCVHPKTGRVCVTLSSEQLAVFNPLAVPTID